MSRKYENWDFYRLLDELDEGMENPTRLVQNVLRSGLKLKPEEAIDLIYYDTDAEKEILDAVVGSFEPDQVAELREYIGMDRLEELFMPHKTKNTWARQAPAPARPGRNSSGLRAGRGSKHSGYGGNARGNRKGSRNKPNRSF